jgi:hypothetical protein
MIAQLIPTIWADTLNASLSRRTILDNQLYKEEQAQHQQRMLDPNYARAYELEQAENEAESYWTALYDNQLPETGEDEW